MLKNRGLFLLLLIASSLLSQDIRVEQTSVSGPNPDSVRGHVDHPERLRRFEFATADGARGLVRWSPNGEWESGTIPLAPGANHIVFTATERDGTIRETSVTVEGPLRNRPLVRRQKVTGTDGRELSYELVPSQFDGGDLAVADGCLLLGRSSEETKNQKAALTLSAAGRLWTNATVVYQLDATLTAKQRDDLRQAMEFWEKNSPVKFRLRTTETVFTRAVRLVPDQGACFSSLGMPATGEGFLRLADSCSVGTLIHELGHTLGMRHEQTRRDRDQFINLVIANMQAEYYSTYAPGLLDSTETSAYDFGSNMHYGQFNFSRSGASVFTTRPRGLNVAEPEASPTDLDAVSRLYGVASTQTIVTTNPPGWEVEVDGEIVTTPRSFAWPSGSAHTLKVAPRQGVGAASWDFGRWSDDGPAAHTYTATATGGVVTAHLIRQCRIDPDVPSPINGGTYTVTPHSPDGLYPCDSEITFTAIPAEGFQFLRWNALGLGGINPVTLRIGASFTFRPLPIFGRGAVTTFVTEPPGRFVTVNNQRWITPVSFNFAAGARPAILAADQAQRNYQFRFRDWSTGPAAAQTLTIPDGPSRITARFRTFYELTRTVFGTGQVTATPTSTDGMYEAGSRVTLTAVPGTGRTFVNWGFDGAGTVSPLTVTMDDEKNVSANFNAPAAPTIGMLSVSRLPAGSPAITLQIAGTNLVDGLTRISLNGTPRAARIWPNGSAQLELTAADLAQAGTLRIMAANGALSSAPGAFTVTPPEACAFELEAATAEASAQGGVLVLPLKAQCNWLPVSDSPWLEAVAPARPVGSTFLNLRADRNPSAAPRTATVLLNDQTLIVTQPGQSCQARLSPASVTNKVAAAGATLEFHVGLFLQDCAWNAVSDAEWVTIEGPGTGMGTALVKVAAYEGAEERTATVTLGGATVTITQSGVPAAP